MNVTGSWRIVSSPDFDDDYLRMEVEPYVELHQRRDRVSGTYHVGLQQGEIDGRIEGADRIVFSFEGMDEMEEVHGRGHCRSTVRRHALSWSITRATRSPSCASSLRD